MPTGRPARRQVWWRCAKTSFIASGSGGGTSSISRPNVGRKMQAVGDVFVVIAGVEVSEDAVRLVTRGTCHFDHVRQSLPRLLGSADVLPRRAELAGHGRRPAPVETAVRNVDTEVVALEDANAVH